MQIYDLCQHQKSSILMVSIFILNNLTQFTQMDWHNTYFWTKKAAFQELIRKNKFKPDDTVGIDASNFYQTEMGKLHGWIREMLRQHHTVSHVHRYIVDGLNSIARHFFQQNRLLFENVECVVVFDGLKIHKKKILKEKTYTLEKDHLYKKKKEIQLKYGKKSKDQSLPKRKKSAKKRTLSQMKQNKFNDYFSRMTWRFRSILIANLEDAGIEVQCAPFEADHQLVHQFREGRITYIWSRDTGLISHGVPLITQLLPNGKQFMVIDMRNVRLQSISHPILRKYVQQTRLSLNKQAIFGVLSGSGILKQCQHLSIHQIMSVAVRSLSLAQFFMIVDKQWPNKGRQITQEYRDDADIAMKAFKFGTCYDKKNKRLEYLDHSVGSRAITDHDLKQIVGNWWYYDIKFNDELFEGRRGFSTIFPLRQEKAIYLGKTIEEKRRALGTNEEWVQSDFRELASQFLGIDTMSLEEIDEKEFETEHYSYEEDKIYEN